MDDPIKILTERMAALKKQYLNRKELLDALKAQSVVEATKILELKARYDELNKIKEFLEAEPEENKIVTDGVETEVASLEEVEGKKE